MSKSVKIVTTVLPKIGGKYCEFSISLNPQLDMRGERITIGKHYPIIRNWPDLVGQILINGTIALYDSNGNLVDTFSITYSQPPPTYVNRLWEVMIPEHTPVSQSAIDINEYRLAEHLSQEVVQEHIRTIIEELINHERSKLNGNDASSPLLNELQELVVLPLVELLNHQLFSNKIDHPLVSSIRTELTRLYDKYISITNELNLRINSRELKRVNVNQKDEFHNLFAGYSLYPELLRNTGWIFDVKVNENDCKRLKNINKCYLVVKELISSNSEWLDEVEFLNNYTCVTINSKQILTHNLKPQSSMSFFSDYVINPTLLKPTLVNRQNMFRRIETLVSNKDTGGTQQGYSDSGITLNFTASLDFQNQGLVDNPTKNAESEIDKIVTVLNEKQLLYLHNTISGFRVTVKYKTLKKNSSDQFGSITKRFSKYYDSNNQHIMDGTDKEGWITEVIQSSVTEISYLDQEVFTWKDQNLLTSAEEDFDRPLNALIIASSPRHTNSNKDIKGKDINGNDIMGAKLRYGWTYQFALRLVDLCGNSLSYNQVHVNQYSESITYQRVNGIHAPQIFYLSSNVSGDEHTKDLETLLIRSFISSNHQIIEEASFTGFLKTDLRLIGPPSMSIDLVLQNDVFDELENLERKTILDLLDINDVTDNKVYKSEMSKINYLFDPLVAGFELIVDGILYSTGPMYDGKFRYVSTRDSYCYDQRYSKITLVHLPTTSPVDYLIDDKSYPGNFLVGLKPGCEIEIELSCFALKEINFGNDGVSTKNLFLNGIQCYYRRKLKFVHAVQKPCLIHGVQEKLYNRVYVYKEISIVRNNGSNQCKVTIKFDSFPVLTCDRFNLHVFYLDVKSNRFNSLGYDFDVVAKVVVSDILPLSLDNEENVVFKDITHDMPDCKHHLVVYEVEAISKFRAYYKELDKDLKRNDPHPYSIFGVSDKGVSIIDYLRGNYEYNKFVYNSSFIGELFHTNPSSLVDYFYGTGDRRIITSYAYLPYDKEIRDRFIKPARLLNTKKPLVPSVQVTVPILTREENDNGFVKRTCKNMRVYFDCDWYSSGWGEKVVVIYRNSCNSVNISKDINSMNVFDCKGQDYSLSLSHFGNDPLSTSSDVPSLFPLINTGSCLNDLPCLINTQGDISQDPMNNWLMVCARVYEVKFDPAGTNKLNPGGLPGRHFIDIELDEGILSKYYMPFLRFALARYQEHSLSEVKFSNIVMTDFVFPLANRGIRFDEANSIITYTCHNVKEGSVIFVIANFVDSDRLDLKKFKDHKIQHIKTTKIGDDLDVDFGGKDSISTITILEFEVYDNGYLPFDDLDQVFRFNDIRYRLVLSFTKQVSSNFTTFKFKFEK